MPPMGAAPTYARAICCGALDEQGAMVNLAAFPSCERGEPEIEKQSDEPVLQKKHGAGRRNSLERGAQKVAAKIKVTNAFKTGKLRTPDSFAKPGNSKSAKEANEILSILKASENMQKLIGGLGEVALKDLVNAFYSHEAVEGDNVIRQGDFGDRMYICRDGNLDIFVARPGPDGKLTAGDKGAQVCSLGKGALFGESALVYAAPRAATVTVTSPEAKLWALDRDAFKSLLLRSQDQKFRMYDGWLRQVEILKPLNHHELLKIESEGDYQVHENGEYIIKQGEVGDHLYFVEEGTCSALVKTARGKRKGRSYEAGDYFGEIALINNVPRQASVRATGEGCTTLSISWGDFYGLLRPIEKDLKQNIPSRYKDQKQT